MVPDPSPPPPSPPSAPVGSDPSVGSVLSGPYEYTLDADGNQVDPGMTYECDGVGNCCPQACFEAKTKGCREECLKDCDTIMPGSTLVGTGEDRVCECIPKPCGWSPDPSDINEAGRFSVPNGECYGVTPMREEQQPAAGDAGLPPSKCVPDCPPSCDTASMESMTTEGVLITSMPGVWLPDGIHDKCPKNCPKDCNFFGEGGYRSPDDDACTCTSGMGCFSRSMLRCENNGWESDRVGNTCA